MREFRITVAEEGSHVVAMRKDEKYCKVCGVKMSSYNPNKYCFVHVSDGQIAHKEELHNRLLKRQEVYRKKISKEVANARNSGYVEKRGGPRKKGVSKFAKKN